jgi:hypothetical protein
VRHAVERNHAAAAEWLLQHASADAELADPTGCRPLHRAVRHWPAQCGTGHRLQTTAPRGTALARAVRHWPAQCGTGHRLQTTAPRGALAKPKRKPKRKPVS